MSKLAEDRPVFHLEADFQHALAWVIREQYPTAKIRLERRVHDPAAGTGRGSYLDLWVELDGTVSAIELKYQTVTLHTEDRGESFALRYQGAEDNLGYDFVSDIARLERFVSTVGKSQGHAILLTNQPLWNDLPKAQECNKDPFRLYEGRMLSGSLNWRDTTKAVGRSNPHILQSSYVAHWRDYSDLKVKNGHFRYLWVPIDSMD